LRKREPQLARPFRVWGYPWSPLVFLLASLAFLIGSILSDRENSLWALALIAASCPVYRIAVFRRH
jgi:APA family basic amino acid/polyamine antiporter